MHATETKSPLSKYIRYLASTALATLLVPGVFASELCPDYKGSAQFKSESHDYCVELWSQVQAPSDTSGKPKPLDRYEAYVGEFFNNNCHRDPELKNPSGTSWGRDKDVRDTGPFTASRDAQGNWVGAYHGFHSPVVIWYSPDMMDWLQRNRPADGDYQFASVEPIPDGAIIAKEMYTPPASRCSGLEIENMQPAHGIAYMVRDNKAVTDGWFWGYFGHFDQGKQDPNIDWPPRVGDSSPYAGFGQYCLNCHASAENNGTFSDLANIEGQPGTPISYLSQDWFLTEIEGDLPSQVQHVPLPLSPPIVNPSSIPPAFSARFPLPAGQSPGSVESFTLPSQTYDNVWVKPGDPAPPTSSEYVTSDQCAGCHDAGSTGLQFDMTAPNPHGDDLLNLSPYATWRTSPMGLAGRDPIFYAQLSSEESMHPESLDLIWNTCFGCHGIMGQRQLQLDKAKTEEECSDVVFTPDIINSVPYSKEQTANKSQPHYDLDMAPYGALARDGVSCLACHRAALTPDQTAKYGDQVQNTCVKARQDALNTNPALGGLSGFAKTFTGSYPVSDPGTVFGPFDNPKTKPMSHALNVIPEHDDSIASSEQCGTCHTVHLPVLWQPVGGKTEYIADTYEQTTYPEWLFSQFRTGSAAFLPEGELLPGGAGESPRSCADCHMESRSDTDTVFKSKIASIQEHSNMPQAAYALGAEDIDLEVRNNFARHTLVGLNLFLVSMAEQFPNVLGIPGLDPMLGKKGYSPIQRTADKMVENATKRTATIEITQTALDQQSLSADVAINNLVGHKFPSGVSFRRAYVQFEVLGELNKVLWQSGSVDEYGVLTDSNGNPLEGELWYDQSCNKIIDQTSYQPHYQTITHPEQVQIYQEVKLDPGDPLRVIGTPSCGIDAPIESSANLTTSFLSICHTAKDNRLLPAGLPPVETRLAIAQKLGLGDAEAKKLVEETNAKGVGDDPDYINGGGDSIRYQIPLSSLTETPISVRASLHYQATPPFFMQDRFCTGSGANRDRLYYLSAMLETKGTPIENWKFSMVTTGPVAVK